MTYAHLASPTAKVLHIAEGLRDVRCGRTYRKPIVLTEEMPSGFARCSHCFDSEGRAIRARAHRLVRAAVRAGLLKRQPCPCGSEIAVAHHDDYGKPLAVRWLCYSCHALWHRDNDPLYTDLENYIRSQRVEESA